MTSLLNCALRSLVKPKYKSYYHRVFSVQSSSSDFSSSDKKKYFDKVLIANRGEIACRIIRTCDKLGIKTVAVHSTADARAIHVQLANESICIGPPASLLSYLNADKVLEAAQTTGAQAIHPGYGFLSENSTFSRKVNDLGMKFIGPSASSIEAMGDKITSKIIAHKANVNTIPGYNESINSAEQALDVANQIGYPVMIKATAGGGGKGMRICYSDEELREGFKLSMAEARNFFNDERVFVEKYIEHPHHIEIQLLAGKTPDGSQLDVLCFPERECSIQRRNQKVIEESPSCLLLPDTRREMVKQVKRLVNEVGYESAGTVEFLVDEKQNFYFLEMNTRLQVEHPVSEEITNVDLVELMLRVAAGKGVPTELLAAANSTYDGMLPHKGWAMEARIYAEDPHRGFLPSIGPLLQYQEPPSTVYDGIGPVKIRVDSGVTEGSEISVYYDPMISKLIAYSDNRDRVIDGLVQALDRYVIQGVQHNAPFVQSVIHKEDFRKGKTPTDFVLTHYPMGFTGIELNEEEKSRLAVSMVLLSKKRRELLNQPPLPMDLPFVDDHLFLPTEFEKSSDVTKSVTFDQYVKLRQQPHISTLIVRFGGLFGKQGSYEVSMDSKTGISLVRTMQQPSDERCSTNESPDEIISKFYVETLKYHPSSPIAELHFSDDKAMAIQFHGEDDTGILRVQIHGALLEVIVMSPGEYELSKWMREPAKMDTSNVLQSPMPGTLITVSVMEGQEVEIGQELCVVEAMKMQNILRSSKKGIISKVKVDVGASVKVNQIIMEFEGS